MGFQGKTIMILLNIGSGLMMEVCHFHWTYNHEYKNSIHGADWNIIHQLPITLHYLLWNWDRVSILRCHLISLGNLIMDILSSSYLNNGISYTWNTTFYAEMVPCWFICFEWIHCGLMTLYSDIELGQLTVAHVMACCLTASSNYLDQCWFIISKAKKHSSEGNFTWDTSAINQ